MRYLSTLRPGTRFRLHEMHEVTGVLVKLNDCRAVVRLDRPERDVEFVDHNGETRQFRSRGSQVTSWAPTTVVEPISFQPLEEDVMSKTTTKKTKSPKTQTTKVKAPKADKPAKATVPKTNDKLSAIDAAAKVLGEAGEALSTKQMIDAMASKGYWTSPGGKTPAGTLYSAILREIQTKGKEARFQKTERGKFALNGSPASTAKPTGKVAKTKTSKSGGRTPGPKAVSELFKL